MGTLDGKGAIVTGASRGIGRAIAEWLSRDGAKVVVNYVQHTGETEEVVEAVERTGSQAVNMTPLGRLDQPDDVAYAVAFLVSEDGRWMTGQLVRAGGGLM